MALEAKRSRHVAVAIPIVAVGILVTTCPRQQRAQPHQPDITDNQPVSERDSWSTTEEGQPLRKLLSGKLVDVAPVTSGAYPDATCAMRSLSEFACAPIEEVLARAQRGELRAFLRRSDIDGGRRPMWGRDALLKTLARRWPNEPLPQRLSPRQRQLEVMARRWPQPSKPLSGRQALVRTLAKEHPNYLPY